jgi:thiol-disulfide isomerase/thioredoxin
MKPQRFSIKKIRLLPIVIIMEAYSLTAQVSNSTLGEAKIDSSGLYFGKLIMEMPFGAKLYQKQYYKPEDLLNDIKNYCKGNAIFIDVWATWCPPCLEAMPNTKRLYIETKNLPVKFIYICTDYRTNIDDWITRVSYLNLPGIHLYVNDDMLTQMMKLLNVGGGFPSYVFIDKNGQCKPEAIPRNSSTTSERLIEWISK